MRPAFSNIFFIPRNYFHYTTKPPLPALYNATAATPARSAADNPAQT